MHEKKPPQNQKVQPISSNRFVPNSNYFTICVYALALVALSTTVIISIVNWNNTTSIIRDFLTALNPFIIAFFIAYLLNPFVRGIDKFLHSHIFKKRFVRGRKLLSICITYLIVLTIITIILLYIGPELKNSIDELNNLYMKLDVSVIESQIRDSLNQLSATFPGIDASMIQEKINEFIPSLLNYGTQLVSDLFPKLLDLSFSIVKIVINILLSIVISCYMLADKPALTRNTKRFIFAIFSKKTADHLFINIKESNNIFNSFIIGKSIDSLIIGIICFVVMKILGLDYAMLLSVIVGITNMIPYFGPFIGAIPGVLIYLFVAPVQAVIFTIMILALQQFDGLYLGPKILGESTGLTPLWVIFAITIGGAYGGVLGMFLGVPIIAVVAYLLDQWINRKLESKHITIES